MFINDNPDVGKIFGVELIMSSDMNSALKRWDDISTGNPPWLNSEDDIKTVNMAKLISDTRAKLTVLDIDIGVSGSPRADFLQTILDDLKKRLRDRVEEADRVGGMIIKWNGETWDFVMNGSFGITDKNDNGEITGAIFASHTTQNGEHFTRLEYHRFVGEEYKVTNKAFQNTIGANGKFQLGREVPMQTVNVWAHLQPEVGIAGLEHPLFGYYRVPGANIIDPGSPLGAAVFAGALTELEAIDIAISRKDAEIDDSKHITFVGQQVIQNAQNKNIELPRFVKGLGMGLSDAETTAIHEHTPTLLTEGRIKDINFDLSLAGVKCGFSEGVFVLDGQTGMITATQVEADDRDTIQTIKTDR
ncbi:MAG: phage capsid protein, partial [Clostridia bacterium]|nr:phage capsid protein [Clostridia bacterium]